MRIYKTSDRIPVKIDDVEFKISPLTFEQKSIISSCVKTVAGETVYDGSRAAFLGVKYAVKEVKGITHGEEEFELEFDDGVLSDECVNDLLNLELNEKIIITCTNLLCGIPDKIIDTTTGTPLVGVEFNRPTKKVKPKK